MKFQQHYNVLWLFAWKMCSLAKCQNALLSYFERLFCSFLSDAVFAKKRVHTSYSELCRTVFKGPTCCSRGEMNVEQAKRRNAFKAPLIELDGLQSQRQSVSTRLRLTRSWDVPHTYTSLNRLLWLTAPLCRQTLQRQWELHGKVVWKKLPPPSKWKSPGCQWRGSAPMLRPARPAIERGNIPQ